MLPKEITSTFSSVASECFSATNLINQFDQYQECYPEEIWRLDIQRKYIRTFTGESVDNSKPKHDVQYLRDMMQGRKKYQRRQWMRDQEIYFGTMNLMNTVVGDDNRITFRCFTPTGDDVIVKPDYTLRITPYSDMYLSVMFGNGGTQQVRAKGGIEYTIECPLSTMDDTQVTIYGANRIQALSDLSACYIAANNFSMATRLRKLVLGNTTEGYNNSRLVSLTLGNNKLLEELDIRNCGSLTGSINLAQCNNLLKLYAEGTGLTGVTFATNGKVQIAHLPNTINTLTMRNLNNLLDFDANLSRLETLTLQGGTLNSLDVVSECINTLQVLNLYDIDWVVSSTELLNKMYNLFSSLVTGKVYISGQIRNQELVNYSKAWNDLAVTYNSSNLITQYLATYVNPDGTVLYTTYVDQGAIPPDPVELGYISIPTQASDAQYAYTYSGWDDITSAMLGARTITAQYSQTVRTYTVTWYAREGLSLGSVKANYGEDVKYEGDLPTDTSGENQFIYKVFTGWNKSTGYITEDTDVYAVWETANTLPSTKKDLSEMSCAEIYGICQAGKAEEYFELKDHFDIILGSDFDFDNVTSEVLLENRFFDGSQYVDTNIKLFDEDSPSFTLVVDYEFLNSTVNNGCLVSTCVNNDGEGFKLQFNTNPSLKWGDKTVVVGANTNRNIVVLRHIKGSNTLFIYSYNKGDTTYDSAITKAETVRVNSTSTKQVLTFGGIRNSDGSEHGFYGKGWIYWAKIWYNDLGDNVARKLASWIHEPLRMEFIGANRYLLLNSMNNYANASFLANNLLPLLRRMNPTDSNNNHTNTGGWAESEMRTFLNTRIYEALSYKWQSVIKQVGVKSSEGNTSYSITTSNDKLYLAANREVGGSTSSPYIDEVNVTSTIGYFTSDKTRLKFCGVITKDEPKFIVENTEPTLLTSYTVSEGDIWVNTNNQNIGYIYMSADTISKHSRIGYRAISSTDNIQASDGGCWVRAVSWWERSPGVSYSTNFMYVYIYGYPNSANSAGNANGVCLGFSI